MNLFHPVSSRSVQPSRLRTLFSGILIASLLAGLFPAPLLTTVASNTLPAPVASGKSATALLPEASVAKAEALPVARSAAVAPIEKSAEAVVEAPLQIAAAAPLMQSPVVTGSSVLTISKSVIGSTQSNFQVTLSGPSYPSGQLFSIISGTNVINNLASGIYTVTETSPGAGWMTTYTATTGYSTGGSAVVTLTNPITATTFAAAQITGTVYNDYNSDGLITANGIITDTGVQSVTVTIYDNLGNFTSTVSSASGRYTITPSFNGPYRVEFTNLPSGYEPSRVSAGTQNGTSVQFVLTNTVSARTLNFGVLDPCDYCQSNPQLAMDQFVNGDPLAVGSGSALTPTLLLYNYNSSGTSAARTVVGTASQTGAIWGLAYDRVNRQLFSSSLLRRHVGAGPGGLGAIYLSSPPSAAPTLFITLTGAVTSTISNGSRGLSGALLGTSRDNYAFDNAGKVGIGDIDISEDGQQLYAVNLLQRRVEVIDTATKAVSSLPALPDPGCVAGVARPWALKVKDDKIYVGVTCTAENSGSKANLRAYVYSSVGGGAWNSEITGGVALNYERACSYTYNSSTTGCGGWNPWIDDRNDITSTFIFGNSFFSHPSPILSDIEFDDDGSMLLGFIDRTSMQMGAYNYPPNDRGFGAANTTLYYYVDGGDLLRVHKINGSYVVENRGLSGEPITAGNVPATGAGSGEYYFGENYQEPTDSDKHYETSLGGLAVLPGSRVVVETAFDPFAVAAGLNLDTNGVIWLSSVTGNRIQNLRVNAGANNTTGYFAKTGGMGDVELLCDPAPIEIGNRVWWDQDGDGVQDAGEPGISGVVVSLQTVSGTVNTTTDINGNYYFTREATSGAYSTTLRTNTNYTITINSSPAGYSLTVANAQALAGAGVSSNNAISDVRDSDAWLVGSIPTIYYTTGTAGQSNHGLDFGFTKPVSGQVDILNSATLPAQFGDRVWIESDGDGLASTGTITPVAGMVINAFDGSNTYTATTNSSGYYSFSVPAGTYTVTYGSVPSGYGTVVPSTVVSGTSVSGNAGSYQQSGNPDGNHGQNTTVTVAAGEANWLIDFAFITVPSPALLVVTKQVTTTDGSTPTVSGSFIINVDCGGATVSPSSSQSVANGGTVTFTVAGGSSCSLSEDISNLPSAPSGYVWVAHQLLPNQVVVSGGVTSTVIAKNTLSPIAGSSGTLTVTKTISGSGSGPFAITLSSASGVVSTTTINGGESKLFTGLTSGIYTVTESTPSGWSTIYTATTGYSTGSSGVVTLSNPITAAVVSAGVISGTVYNDFSLDGQISPSDALVAGVSVSVYDRNGTLVGTATTNISGTYALTPTASGPWRIEFSNLPAGYEPSKKGSQNGSSVQFVSSVPSQANLGIHQPSYYCQANPDCVATQMLSGTINNSTATSGVLVRFPYTSGSTDLTNYTTNNLPVYSTVAQKQQVGSIFGLAWQRTTGSLFSATYYKADADIAVSPGAIFKGSSLYVDLDTIFPGSFGSEPAIGSQASYTVAGKIGLGGIDIVEDPNNFVNDSLYVVSLYDRQLYRVPTSGGLNSSTITRYPIPGTTAPLPGAAQACAQSDVRPMALGQYQGLLYVGLVCSGESTVLTSSLYAYIYTFDPVTKVFGTAPVVQYPLTYTRQSVYTSTGIAYPIRSTWMPWTNNATYNTATASPGVWGTIHNGFFYPSPLLSDIAFDGVGTMIMAFRDRFSDQFGAYVQTICSAPPCWSASAGDILKASKTGAQTWSALIDSAFYDTQHEYHEDTATGGLAQVPGRGDVVATVYDPSTSNQSDSVVSGGVLWMTNSSGIRERQYRVYHRTEVDTFGKMSGMGDVEVLCDVAPIEIGNRVWWDQDGDGVQDAGEPGISGVVVSLQTASGTVNTTTDINGNYYFTREATSGAYSTTLRANTNYTITINSSPAGYSLTVPNAQALTGAGVSSNNAISDVRDSDAWLVSNIPTIYYTTGTAGQNNHSLDFGFTQPASGQVDILNIAPPPAQFGDRLWLESDSDGVASTGTIAPVANHVLTATNAGGPVYTTTTDSNGFYTFTVPAGTYTVTYGLPPAGYEASSTPGGGVVDAASGGNDTSHSNNTVVTLNPNDIITTVDFAFNPAEVSIGNLVWNDVDNDGVVDVGESGIANVVVWLYYDANSNGTIDASEMITAHRTTTTSAQGLYIFSDIVPGNYQVVIPVSNFGSGGALAGYPASSTPTDTVDNQQDEDDNGVQASSALTVTGPVVALVVDDEPINSNTETGLGNTLDDGDDNNGDMTIDFGFFAPTGAVLSINKVATPAVVRAGDLVTYTITLSNSGPDAASNVTVRDLLPAEVTYVSSSATAGIYDTSTSVWTIPSLPVSTQTLTITVRVK